jgi:hypothetical protein
MNAEKELFLALLVEKYTTKTVIAKPTSTQTKRSRTYKKAHHKWTQFEKEKLVVLRHRGESWSSIAHKMGKEFTAKQCHSMWHNVRLAGSVNILLTEAGK